MSEFELITLPYAADALQPVISPETIAFHHGKHLQAYVNNLNNLIAGTKFEGMTLVDIVKQSDGGVFNNAGQILNHNLYFEALQAPQDDNQPTGKIAAAIAEQFGSFADFKQQFQQQGASLFGSGWVWLSEDTDGRLVISQETNAQNPVTKGLVPLLTFDVWEHAYYVDYRNRRPDYLSAMWSIVNWDVVNQRMK
ncbi:MAG: superoxide dismutase [Bacteroidaceae bacterium]|nr:superoxide dismutase [Bacteroidaceae bacterium]